MSSRRIDPRHGGTRKVLRTVGPIALLIGIGCIVVAAIDFFGAMGSFESPNLFWLFLLGGPLVAVGFITTALGYMGAVMRYQAGEVAPVAKDTFNYMADGTKDGVKTLARAVGEGLGFRPDGDAGSSTLVRCRECNTENDADAKFCDGCGAALIQSYECRQCGQLNDADAKFCDNCGARLA